jgi:hypothetical protein
MQHYVDQLLEMLQEAQKKRPALRHLELPEETECLNGLIDADMLLEEDKHVMESIFDLPQMYFPPEDRLSDSQIKQVTEGILDLWHAFHYEADIRKGEYTDREIYTKLVNCWKKSYPLLRGVNGAWHIELYNYQLHWDEKRECYISEEEYILPF